MRYERNAYVQDKGEVELPVIPTPVDFYKRTDNTVDIEGTGWLVVATNDDPTASKVAMYLAGKVLFDRFNVKNTS